MQLEEKIKSLTPEEKKLFAAKTPEAYIEKSLKVKLTSGKKANVTRLWLAKTGFSIDQIKAARNRNPYWKKEKMKGSDVRNIIRRDMHDYSNNRRKTWSLKDINYLIDNNHKKDWELAKHFKVSIPAIQARRRSLKASKAILAKQGVARPTKSQWAKLALKGDKYLMRLRRELK